MQSEGYILGNLNSISREKLETEENGLRFASNSMKKKNDKLLGILFRNHLGGVQSSAEYCLVTL